MNRILIACILAAASASDAAAQGTILPREPGDTTRFRQETNGVITMEVGARRIEMKTEHDALIAISHTRGDTARAWYEELSIRQTGASGEQAPATRDALRKPFTLLVTGRGETTTLSTPEFPESFGWITDLTKQFVDFFPTTPPGYPLATGLMWSDSMTHEDQGEDRGSRNVAVHSYRVRGDSTIDGERVMVAEMTGRTTIVTTVVRPGGESESKWSGTEVGLVFFTPAGRFVASERRGELAGTITTGAETMRTTHVYQSDIRPHRPR